MFSKYIQQFFQLGAIQFRTDNNEELMIKVKELIPEMGGQRLQLYI